MEKIADAQTTQVQMMIDIHSHGRAHRFVLPPHACVSYVPAAHVAQAAHTASLDAPHGVAAYCPQPHTVHGVHTASKPPPHACAVK